MEGKKFFELFFKGSSNNSSFVGMDGLVDFVWNLFDLSDLGRERKNFG